MKKTWAILMTSLAVAAVSAGCSSSPAKPSNTNSTPGLHEFGAGSSTTHPFAVSSGAWTVAWHFTCTIKSVFTFHAVGTGASAGVVEKGAADIAKSGSGVVHYKSKGTFSLAVAAGPTCQWSLLVTQK
jgi:hypothetical protein